MEYEIRFYYPLTKYKEKLLELKKTKELNFKGRKYEITSQFDHPSKKFSFYTKEVDGRFRIRKTESKKGIKEYKQRNFIIRRCKRINRKNRNI